MFLKAKFREKTIQTVRTSFVSAIINSECILKPMKKSAMNRTVGQELQDIALNEMCAETGSCSSLFH